MKVLSRLLSLLCVGAWAAEPAPEFQLADANPSSLRYGAQVSPRDYRLQVSAFYFGAAG